MSKFLHSVLMEMPVRLERMTSDLLSDDLKNEPLFPKLLRETHYGRVPVSLCQTKNRPWQGDATWFADGTAPQRGRGDATFSP